MFAASICNRIACLQSFSTSMPPAVKDGSPLLRLPAFILRGAFHLYTHPVGCLSNILNRNRGCYAATKIHLCQCDYSMDNAKTWRLARSPILRLDVRLENGRVAACLRKQHIQEKKRGLSPSLLYLYRSTDYTCIGLERGSSTEEGGIPVPRPGGSLVGVTN